MTKEHSLPALPCACASLRRAARAVTQLYDDEMRASGLKATQFTILQVLGTRGESRQSAIGEVLALDATTLTRTMKLLSREGWVESRPGEDRRERYWRLTESGTQILEAAKPQWKRAQRRLRRGMEQVNWAELMHVTTAAAEAARRNNA